MTGDPDPFDGLPSPDDIIAGMAADGRRLSELLRRNADGSPRLSLADVLHRMSHDDERAEAEAILARLSPNG